MDQLKSISRNIILATGVAIFLQLILGNYIVDGASMSPTLNHNQRVFVNKFLYYQLPNDLRVMFQDMGLETRKNPKRGEVVIFEPPFPYDTTGKDFVKRIIGTPGDQVQNVNGTIFVNGTAFSNEFGNTAEISEKGVTLIPNDYYYLLGDNRSKSNDSRSFGLIHRSSIKGRVWVIYWPFSNLRIFDYNLISGLKDT
jgi:signal peptidase I|tara:strand:- start:136 stop:726 length:591 start_codon:yes stop_codon:yes gene_type:complete